MSFQTSQFSKSDFYHTRILKGMLTLYHDAERNKII